jgi:hypothetical protein
MRRLGQRSAARVRALRIDERGVGGLLGGRWQRPEGEQRSGGGHDELKLHCILLGFTPVLK